MASLADLVVTPAPVPPDRVYRRHPVFVRVCHWTNVICLTFLIMTGLNIFDAHPSLYWGQYGANADDNRRWLQITADTGPHGRPRGITRIGPLTLVTTGVLGWNRANDGTPQAQGFPDWATFPHNRDLATSRRWHFFFAWAFILNGIAYFALGFATRHLQDDVWPRLRQLSPANLWRDIVNHATLHFPRGADDKHYHVLQRLAYAGTVFVLLPTMVLSGLSLSPGFDAAAGGFLPQLFGGRASARSVHFITMDLILVFTMVHVAMVVLAGPINQLRSMITGWYDVGDDRK